MRVSPSTITEFLEAICKDSSHRTAQFWREYWFGTGHHRRLLQVIEKLDPYLESKPAVLDIGSFGEFPLILLKFYEAPVVHANSFEGGVICYGKGRLLETGDPDIELAFVIEQCDIERRRMTQAAESLDMVTCFEVLEHLRYDPMFMMLEIHRVLRPNGLLVLTTPNASSWETMARVTALESPFIASSYFANGSGIIHCKEYSASEIQQLLKNAGFKLERLETFDTMAANENLAKVTQELKDISRSRDWAKEELRRQTFLVLARKSGRPKMRRYLSLYTEDEPFLEKKPTPAEASAAELRQLLEAETSRTRDLQTELQDLRESILNLQMQFEDRTCWALKLGEELKAKDDTIANLQAQFEERTRWALSLDEEVKANKEYIAQLQAQVDNRERRAQEIDQEVRQLREEAEKLQATVLQCTSGRFLLQQLWKKLQKRAGFSRS
jgi:SAM-dependent methyltransferase